MQGPELLFLARHGQSAGNVALELAEANQASVIDIAARDVDVPLSSLGEQQAEALGIWLAQLETEQRPTVVLSSPYLRARQTAEIALKEFASSSVAILDERLREREFGVVDRLTKKGIFEKFPEQAELHARLGKFYYRAPGGESWCDVILRLRSLQDSLAREYKNEKVLLVCHSVVILCFRYLLEQMTEAQILKIDHCNQLANCSITSYARDPKKNNMMLVSFNSVAPLSNVGEKVTAESDAPNSIK